MSRFKIEKKIIKDREMLNIGTTLSIDDILHRTNEIKMLTYHFSTFFDGNVPNNLVLFGPTGCGKTMLIKLLTSELKKDAEKDGRKLFIPYINCVDTYTNMSVMTLLLQHASFQMNMEIGKLATSYNVYSHAFIKMLKEFNGTTIIIFDEIDKLQDPNSLIYLLSRLKENGYTEQNICIIGISNDLYFTKKLDVRANAALCETEANIIPYEADELIDILNQRAQYALQPESYDENIILEIAKTSARDTGDARKAIDLLRVSADLAEQENHDKILLEDIRTAEWVIETGKDKKIIQTLPMHQKLAVLACMYHITEKRTPDANVKDAYKTYYQFCKLREEKPKGQRTFYDYIADFDNRGIISIEKTSKGRGKGVSNLLAAGNLSPDDLVGLILEDAYMMCLQHMFTQRLREYEMARKKYEQTTLL